MNEEAIYIDYQELIVRYLVGDADDKEQRLLLQWLKESPDHVQEFNRLRQISDTFREISSKPEFHLDEALAAFDKQTENAPLPIKKESSFRRIIWITTSVAAVAVLLISISLNIFTSNDQQVLAKSEGSRGQVVLTDGTKVVLSKGTKIFASKSFNKDHRIISLQGEAFFQVKHDEAHPFTIEVNNITVTDIGTAFKVSTDSITKNSSVVVKEGIVRINYFGQVCLLHPGDYAKTDANNKQLVVGLIKPKVKTTTSNNELVFENTPLDEVVASINKRYNTNFVLASSSLSDYKLNASFNDNTSIKQIKELLSIVLNVDIKNSEGKMLIYTHTD